MPFSDTTMDAIVCDIPFGRQHSTPEGVAELCLYITLYPSDYALMEPIYPIMLCEIYRTLKLERRVVLLTCQSQLLKQVINDLNNSHQTATSTEDSNKQAHLQILETVDVKLGKLYAVIFVLLKTTI